MSDDVLPVARTFPTFNRACTPATTTHHRLTEKQQLEAGIHPNLIRLSVGLEDVPDLIAALDQVL